MATESPLPVILPHRVPVLEPEIEDEPESQLHGLDTASNRATYMNIMNDTIFVDLPVLAVDFMGKHYPVLEASKSLAPTLLATLDARAKLSLEQALRSAFPEYRSYGLLEMVLGEVAQNASKRYNNMCRLDVVEGMAGCQSLSKAMRELGVSAVALDRLYHTNLDLATNAGFRAWCLSLRHLRKNGLLWLAVECKTWVWIGRCQTGRSKSFPLGDESNPKVREANKVMLRVAFLCIVATCVDVSFIVEQPVTSLLDSVPVFQGLMRAACARRVPLDLGAYGAPTKKPLKLWGTTKWLNSLTRRVPRNWKQTRATAVTKTVVVKGSAKRVSRGLVKELSASEHYSQEFAKAVALAFSSHDM